MMDEISQCQVDSKIEVAPSFQALLSLAACAYCNNTFLIIL